VGDPKVLGTIKALAEDGAYSKAFNHLFSEAVLDANDPAVVSQLQALHPPGHGGQVSTQPLGTPMTSAFEDFSPSPAP
jgi:hypothetical protein